MGVTPWCNLVYPWYIVVYRGVQWCTEGVQWCTGVQLCTVVYKWCTKGSLSSWHGRHSHPIIRIMTVKETGVGVIGH